MGDRTRIRMYANQNTPSSSTPIPSGFVHQRPFPVPAPDTETSAPQPIPDLQARLEVLRRANPDWSKVKFSTPPAKAVQPRLTVGAPNDQYEQEADRVADQVISMPDAAVPQPVQRDAMSEEEEVRTKPLATSITPLVQREMALEEEEVQPKLATDGLQREALPEEEESVQMKQTPNPSLESRLNRSKGRGSPLLEEMRSVVQRDNTESPSISDDQGSASNDRSGEDSNGTSELQAQATALQQLEQYLNLDSIQSALEQIDLSGLPVPDNNSNPSDSAPSTPNLYATPATSLIDHYSNSIFRQTTRRIDPPSARIATAEDFVKALMEVQAIANGLKSLKTQGYNFIKNDWSRLNTAERVSVLSTTALIGGGVFLLSPEARRFALDKLNGQVLPVPGVNWLHFEFNRGGNNLMLGMHLDLGQFLPPILGFGPSSSTPKAIEPLPGQRMIQRVDEGTDTGTEGKISQRIHAELGSGSKLDEGVQQNLEQHLNADLSNVRIHTDGEADRLSKAVNAIAFTTEQDIFFSSGSYNPTSKEGQHLITHEVVHTVQQANGAVAGTATAGDVSISDPSDQFEQEAERLAGQVVNVSGSTTQQSIQGETTPEKEKVPTFHSLSPNKERMLQRQESDKQKWHPQAVPSERIDKFFEPNSPLWRQLNPDQNSTVNCPATAAAVDKFLATGSINPAEAGYSDSEFIFKTKPWSSYTTFQQIRSVVSKPNTFVVVEGVRSKKFSEANKITPSHWFVIVNRNGIRGIDAFGAGQTIADLPLFIKENGFAKFRYYQGSFTVRRIPKLPPGL